MNPNNKEQPTANKKIPRQKHVLRVLIKHFPELKAQRLFLQTQTIFWKMLADAPETDNRALLSHLKNTILPGAALYSILKEEIGEENQAKGVVTEFYHSALLFKKRLIHLMGRLPFYPWLLKVLTPRTMKTQYPYPGWNIEFIEASNQRLAFNMHSCYYVDTLNYFNLGELAPLYCDLDNFINDEMSPYIRWCRTKTIGYGDDYCDFEFINTRFTKDD